MEPARLLANKAMKQRNK